MPTTSVMTEVDFAAKGIHDVVLEHRYPADLWLRGRGVLRRPSDLWPLLHHTKASINFELPLKISFEIAQANRPEFIFASAALSKHYETWEILLRDGCVERPGPIAYWHSSDGLWVISVDRGHQYLPTWWKQNIQDRLRSNREIAQDLRHEDVKRVPSSARLDTRHSITTNGSNSTIEREDATSSNHITTMRDFYEPDDEDLQVKRLGEGQWLTAVKVLIQMADWVLAMRDRNHQLLICRPRFFTVDETTNYASKSSFPSDEQPFSVNLSTFAALEQLDERRSDGPHTERDSPLQNVSDLPLESTNIQDNAPPMLAPRQVLVRNLIEVDLKHVLRYVAPEAIAAEYPKDPTVEVFAWGVAAYELLKDAAKEAAEDPSVQWNLLDAVHNHSTKPVSNLMNIHDNIPIELSQLVDKAMSLDPVDRYKDLATLIYDLKVIHQICSGNLSKQARLDFVVGDIVQESTFTMPNMLLDRKAELQVMDEAYSRVKVSGKPEVVCCYALSGAGKSYLLEKWACEQEIRNAGQECLVGWSKLDQHLMRPLSGFIGVFCALLERVFSDPLEDPSVWRRNILDAVAVNINLFLSLLPSEWRHVLHGSQSEAIDTTEAEIVDWESYIQQFRSWATMLFRLFSSSQRPLIIGIDDFQWMDPSEAELWYELASTPARRVDHCLILLSYRTEREGQIPDLHPISATMIEARRFDQPTILGFLVKCFHLDQPTLIWESLANSLLETSSGNPLFCNQILVALVRDGKIHYDFTTRKWQIRTSAMQAYNAMSSEEHSGKVFSLFEPELQRVLQILACLPSRGVKLDLLGKVCRLEENHIRSCIRPAIISDVIRLNSDEVVFSHDRHHHAVLASINDVDKIALFTGIANILGNLPASDLLVFVRADLLYAAFTTDSTCVLSEILSKAIIQAVQRALRGLASDLAQQYLAKLLTFRQIDSSEQWENYPETTLQLVGVICEVAIAKRTASSSIENVERACEVANSALNKIQVLTWLCRLSLACSRAGIACAYVEKAYSLAGVSTEIRHEFCTNPSIISRYVNRPRVKPHSESDHIHIALNVITTVMGPTIYAFLPDLGREIFHTTGTFLLSDAGAAALKHPSSAYIFAIMGLLEMDRLSLTLARSWLELSESIDVAGTPYQASADIARIVVQLIRNTRLSDLDYSSIRDNCIATKNPDILTYVAGLELGTLTMSGHCIPTTYNRGKTILVALGDDLQSISRLMATSFVQLAANLTRTRGNRDQLSKLQGTYITEADRARVYDSAGFYGICFALANLLLGLLFNVGSQDLAERAELLRHFANGGNGTILQPMMLAYMAIWTLVSDGKTEGSLVDEARAFFSVFDQNSNFRGLIGLLDALTELKSVRQQKTDWIHAVERVETTLVQLETAEAYIYQGFLCQQAANTLERLGSSTGRLVKGYRSSAVDAFQRCGAVGLLIETSKLDPIISVKPSKKAGDPISSIEDASSVSTIKDDSSQGDNMGALSEKIGFESVLRTSVLLASEKDEEGLIKRVLSVLMQMTRTTYACLAIQDHARQTLRLKGFGGHERIQICDKPLSEAGHLCPASLLLHVSLTRKAINTTNLLESAHTKLLEREPFFRSSGTPRSVIVAPIFVQGRLSGAIYLANKSPVPSASTSHVGLLATFASIILESHHAYASMELAVETRTNQLEQALAHRQTFISTMSHELRTPLFAVAGLCSVMENSGDLPREHRDNLAIIKQSAEDLQRIVTAVLDWSKLDAGSIQAESIDFGLRNIVEAAAATVSHIAQAKNIEILIDNSIDTDPTHLFKGDPHRIRQCLLNLLSNACKFIPLNHTARPVVRIRWSLEEKGDRVDITIAVQDEGIGIPRKAMSKLFGAFVQVDNGISRNYGGTGLGLSITRGLCRAMGGDCWAESVEGQGSTFYMMVSTIKADEYRAEWSQHNHIRQSALICTSNQPRYHSTERSLKVWNVETYIAESIPAVEVIDVDYDYIIVDVGKIDELPTLLDQAQRFIDQEKLILLVGPADVEDLKKDPAYNHVVILGKPATITALYHATAKIGPKMEELAKLPTLAAKRSARHPHVNREKKFKNMMDAGYAKQYPLNILYVDDSVINVKVGKKILEKFGYTVVDTAEDGKVAVACAESKQYDLVFMDLQMPTMDGYTAQRLIQESEKTGNPSVVALTANADQLTKQRCLDQGFAFFLSKPLIIQDLVITLRDVYASRQDRNY